MLIVWWRIWKFSLNINFNGKLLNVFIRINWNSKMKDYDNALETILKVYGITEVKFGYKSE